MATITPKELATELDTDARTVRKFLRATLPDAAPGKGSRWAIERKQVRSLKAKFAAWVAANAPAPAEGEGDEGTAPDAD